MKKESCPMTQQQILDRYFIKNRVKLLDITAFLDRLDRAYDSNQKQEVDFRIKALKDALQILSSDHLNYPSRTEELLMLFSDPTKEPIDKPKRKGALGAYPKDKD